jgi:hypothetical protein
MAYTPTVWKNGDVITAELLNHLETGVQNEQVGPEGPAGHTGAAAGFGTPTATVDANVGTPAVEITATGDDTAKVFAFAFSNLKGEPGAAGAKGEPGATGATGATGASVTAIELYKDESGAITGGKATLSDASEITITVTTTPTV